MQAAARPVAYARISLHRSHDFCIRGARCECVSCAAGLCAPFPKLCSCRLGLIRLQRNGSCQGCPLLTADAASYAASCTVCKNGQHVNGARSGIPGLRQHSHQAHARPHEIGRGFMPIGEKYVPAGCRNRLVTDTSTGCCRLRGHRRMRVEAVQKWRNVPRFGTRKHASRCPGCIQVAAHTRPIVVAIPACPQRSRKMHTI